MNMKELLPIGSVILLKEGKKKVMIIGVKQMDSETSVEYDYLTVLYPEGFIANAGMFFCNHDAIDEIYHMGYRNEEHDRFRAELEKFYLNKDEN